MNFKEVYNKIEGGDKISEKIMENFYITFVVTESRLQI